MKSFIVGLFLILSFTSTAQKKKEIRFLLVKNRSDVSFDMAVDSSRASFSITNFGTDEGLKSEKNKIAGNKNLLKSEEKILYFGFSHRKTTKIKSLPSVTLEEYYANPSDYILSPRMYIIVPLDDEIFAIWKCSIIGSK